MRKLFMCAWVAMIAVAFWAIPVFAGDSIDDRLDEDRGRIDRGVENGGLVPDEAADVRATLESIRKDYEAARATARERLDRLERMVSDLNANDRRTRPAYEAELRALEERMAAIGKNIDSGRRNGSLSSVEARDLDRGLDDIEADLGRMRREDLLSRRAIDDLNVRLDALSEKVERLKRTTAPIPTPMRPWR